MDVKENGKKIVAYRRWQLGDAVHSGFIKSGGVSLRGLVEYLDFDNNVSLSWG